MTESDPKPTLGTAHSITSAYANRQSKGRDRKDLLLETRMSRVEIVIASQKRGISRTLLNHLPTAEE
jgi:hypothetical protein